MGIFVTERAIHWNYFLAIEQDLAKISRYIEFTDENFDSFSIELAHLLLASSSEVDVVLKLLCKGHDDGQRCLNINDYKTCVCQNFPSLINEKCFIPRFGLTLTPWSNWSGENNPDWWKSYNNVKHQRDTHFHEANLKNALNSVAALGLVVVQYYQDLFSVENRHLTRDTIKRLGSTPSIMSFNEGSYSGPNEHI